jgi:hypothetical protein
MRRPIATGPELAQACAGRGGSSLKAFRRSSAVHNLYPMNDGSKRAAKIRQQGRLSAALRENLKRRKAQAQSRAGPSQASGPRSHDSAGIAGKNRPER